MSESTGMVRFSCPECGKQFQSEARWAGQQVCCSDCGTDIVVPEAPAVPAPRSVPRVASRRPGVASTPRRGGRAPAGKAIVEGDPRTPDMDAPSSSDREAALLAAICPRCGKGPIYAGYRNPNKKGRWLMNAIPVNTWLTDVALESLVCGQCHDLESYLLDAGVRRTIRGDWPKVRPDRRRFTPRSVRAGHCPKCGRDSIHVGRKRREPPNSGARGGNSLSLGLTGGGALDNYVCTRCGYVERYVASEKDIATLTKRWPKALREREKHFEEGSIRSGRCPKCSSTRTHTNARLCISHQRWSIPVSARLDRADTHEWVCTDCGYVERYMRQERDVAVIRRKWTRTRPDRRQR